VRWIFGVHGREWLTEEGELVVAAGDELAAVREQARRWAQGLPFPLLIEDKGAGVAFHYRQAPQAARVVQTGVETLAREHGLSSQHGKMVSELLPVGPSKGEAVARLMKGQPFAGRTPVAVGDDITDEDAFAAATRLGGFSIGVGAGRASTARFILPAVADVRSWLEAPLAEAGP
jgi:trehalose 6-phosphate phosphatase